MNDDFRCSSASVTEFRAHLAEYLRLLGSRRVRFILERHGAPVGALVTFNDFEMLRGRAEDRILAEVIAGSSETRRTPYSELLEAEWLPEDDH